MIERISEEIACECEKVSGKIVEAYHIEIAIREIILFLSFLLIGNIISHILSGSVILPILICMYIGFKPLRGKFGGIHFNSSIVCYLATIVQGTLAGVLAIVINVGMLEHVLMLAIIYSFTLFTFISVGVTDSKVNPLLETEKVLFKQMGYKILIFIVIIQIVVMYLEQSLSIALSYGVLLVSLNLHAANLMRN